MSIKSYLRNKKIYYSPGLPNGPLVMRWYINLNALEAGNEEINVKKISAVKTQNDSDQRFWLLVVFDCP